MLSGQVECLPSSLPTTKLDFSPSSKCLINLREKSLGGVVVVVVVVLNAKLEQV